MRFRCRVAPLPQGWVEYATEDGDSYFHNANRGETVWHHPLDPHFKQLLKTKRLEAKARFSMS